MKTIFISNRIFLFLSFFMPFILLPQCNITKESKANTEISSTTNKDLIDNNLSAEINKDSIKYQKVAGLSDSNNEISFNFHDFLIEPIENTISAYGIIILLICNLKPDIDGVIGLNLLFCFLLSLSGIFLLFIKFSHKIQIIISLICLSLFIVFIFQLFVIVQIKFSDTIWGLWICLILNITNAILTYIIKRKSIINNCLKMKRF